MVSLNSDNSDPPSPQNDVLNSSNEGNALKSELNLSFENDEAAVPNVSTDKITSNNIQSNGGEKYIASLDVGTTLVRCYIFNKKGGIVAQTEDKINLLYPKPRCVEMDPEEVWDKSHSVISKAIQKVGAENIISLGICTQRCTFLTWNSKTGKALHNLITWKDVRADVLVQEWNSSLLMKFLRTSCSLLYFVSNYKRFQAVSVLKFFNAQVILRLKWVLTNNAEVRKLISENSVHFGTLDTWLINKLTGGKVFATDFSNASATAMFDPYLNQWSSFVTGLIGIPMDIFPELRTSAGDWGYCPQDLFGREIPITGVVSDQGASLAGGGGYLKGHVKVTLGTGGFLNLNTGDKPLSSVDGIYPVVGWQTPDGRVVYMAEGAANNVGTVVEWGKRVGLYNNASETGPLANSVRNSAGVYFVPAFQGLQAPINDARAGCGFIGVSANTTKAHMVRALLESLVFLTFQLYGTMVLKSGSEKLDNIKADGGVSSNDFILQQVATLSKRSITRYSTTELSALGAAIIAGIGAGVFKDISEVTKHLKVKSVFYPQEADFDSLMESYRGWKKAIGRFRKWNASHIPLVNEKHLDSDGRG